MTERMNNSSDDDSDVFDELVADFVNDNDFVNTIAGLDDGMDMLDITSLSASCVTALDIYARPHTEQSLGSVVKTLNSTFENECREQGINPNAATPGTTEYDFVREAICEIMLKLKSELWSGDVVAATDVLVIDSALSDESSMHVLGLYGGDKIVGTFGTPVIGSMPDETNAIMLTRDDALAMGVGFLLEDPIVIDSEGNVYANVFGGKQVVVSLNVLGCKLTKYVFTTGL